MDTSDSIQRVLCIGFAIPDETMREIIGKERMPPQLAANILQWKIIRGMESHPGWRLDLLSSALVTSYPYYPHVTMPHEAWAHRDGADDHMIPYVNLVGIKHITRCLSMLRYGMRWARQVRGQRAVILNYAIDSPHLLASVILKRLFRLPLILVVPDLPEHMSIAIRSRLLLKKIDTYFTKKMYAAADGYVLLTDPMADAMGIDRARAMVMEGIANEMPPAEAPAPVDGRVIMYAGMLLEEYGLLMLLDAFAQVKDPDARLWIFGEGPMKETVIARGQDDPRIVYWGTVPNSEVLVRERQATLLINPRYSDAAFTRYSFPSKTLEYMSAGTPVLTTNLPGIPAEYHPYLYLIEEETPDGLARQLRDLLARPQEELKAFGTRAQAFVRDHKNGPAQGRRIIELIERCCGWMGKTPATRY